MGKIGTPRFKNELNKTYGNWLVLSFVKTDKNVSFWLCRCSCGTEKIVRGNTLRNGHSTSCGVCSHKPTNILAPFKKIYGQYRNRTLKRGLEFNISLEEFIDKTQESCFYCGKAPFEKRAAYSRRRYSLGIEKDVTAVFNTLDRIDSSKGYYLANIVSCCFDCNQLKSDRSLSDFYKKIEEIYEHGKKTGIYSENNRD